MVAEKTVNTAAMNLEHAAELAICALRNRQKTGASVGEPAEG